MVLIARVSRYSTVVGRCSSDGAREHIILRISLRYRVIMPQPHRHHGQVGPATLVDGVEGVVGRGGAKPVLVEHPGLRVAVQPLGSCGSKPMATRAPCSMRQPGSKGEWL